MRLGMIVAVITGSVAPTVKFGATPWAGVITYSKLRGYGGRVLRRGCCACCAHGATLSLSATLPLRKSQGLFRVPDGSAEGTWAVAAEGYQGAKPLDWHGPPFPFLKTFTIKGL